MDTPFFEYQKISRQFGELLVISCLLDKGPSTGMEINKWISSKINPKTKEEDILPSSFIYPLLKTLCSGHVSFLKENKGLYSINEDMINKKNNQGQTWLEENFGQSTTASIEFLNCLITVLSQTEKKLLTK